MLSVQELNERNLHRPGTYWCLRTVCFHFLLFNLIYIITILSYNWEQIGLSLISIYQISLFAFSGEHIPVPRLPVFMLMWTSWLAVHPSPLWSLSMDADLHGMCHRLPLSSTFMLSLVNGSPSRMSKSLSRNLFLSLPSWRGVTPWLAPLGKSCTVPCWFPWILPTPFYIIPLLNSLWWPSLSGAICFLPGPWLIHSGNKLWLF